MDNYSYFVESEPECAFKCPACGENLDDERDHVASEKGVQMTPTLSAEVWKHVGCLYPEYEFRILALRER